jgi:hypothetical protein
MVLCNVPFCVLKGIQASLVRHALLSSFQQFENMFVLYFLNMIWELTCGFTLSLEAIICKEKEQAPINSNSLINKLNFQNQIYLYSKFVIQTQDNIRHLQE